MIHPSAQIHHTANIEPNAKIGKNVRIGAFCNISSYAEICDDVQLHPSVTVIGYTCIGEKTEVFAGAFLGGVNKATIDTDSILHIGKNCKIGEGSVICSGISSKHKCTVIGDSVVIEPNAIIYNDCVVGDDVLLESRVTLNEGCRVGKAAKIGANSIIKKQQKIDENSVIDMMSTK